MAERTPYPACPLCSGDYLPDRLAHDDTGRPMPWMRCNACGHSFTAGYFDGEAMADILRLTPECQQVGYQHETLRLASSKMVERVTPILRGGNWLDVGFGNGSLLLTALEYGFAPYGIDLRPSTVEAALCLGIKARCQELTDVTETGFHVISLCDVLEHMPYPKPALLHARKILHPQGVLLLSMPNADSPTWHILTADNRNPYWGEIEHFHNFGRRRLYALLRECGFEPVSYGVSERYRVGMEVVCVSC
jgi:protein O-GlcNAc transferase